MVSLIWRHVLALWLLQAIAGVLVTALYDWPLVAIPLSLLYLACAWYSARSLYGESRRLGRGAAAAIALAVAVLWQMPALLGSLNQIREQLGLTPYDGNSDLLDFAMQTWQLALMPLLGLVPGRGADQLAGYYVGLTVAPPLLTTAYAVIAAWPAVPVSREKAESFRGAWPGGGRPQS